MGTRATALICTALPLETAEVVGLLEGVVIEAFIGRDQFPVGRLTGEIEWDVVVAEAGAENNVARPSGLRLMLTATSRASCSNRKRPCLRD